MIVKSVTSFLRRERKLYSATSLWRVRVSLKFGQISEVQFFYTELEALVVTQLAVRNWNCEQVQNLCKLVAGTYSSQSLLVLFALLGSFSKLVLFLRLLAPMRTNSSVLVSTSEIALEIRHSLLYLSAREDTKKDGNQHNRCVLESIWRRPVPCELVLFLFFFFLIILLLKQILVKSIMIEIFVNGRFQLSRNSRPLKYWTTRFVLHCSAEHQST